MESTMGNLSGKLRPLVGTRGWDYCVLWKLSEDQRSVKWLSCCCSGAEEISNIDGNNNNNSVEEFCFVGGVSSSCRDVMFHHPRTQSCELLAHLPCSIPLDAGIHAETLVSNQTTWLNFSDRSEQEFLQDTTCTRVLIPVPGGLVELFVTRQVPEDQNVVDFVMGQCNILLDHASTGALSINMLGAEEVESKPYEISGGFLPQFGEYDTQHLKLKNDYQALGFLPENKQMGMNPFTSMVAEDEIPGMEALHISMGTGASDLHHVQCGDPSLLVMEQHDLNDKETCSHENGRLDSGSDCSDQIDDEDDTKFKKKTGKGSPAKNLLAERRRRKKLNDRLYALRSLVPKISKLDRASILGDAINYIKELQKEAKELQEELEENSDTEDATNRQDGMMSLNGTTVSGAQNELDKAFHAGLPCNVNVSNLKQDMDPESSNDKGQEMEPQVDVAQVDGKGFFVKVMCEYKPGGFTRLMEALDSLGLEVTNVNTTRFLGLVSNVFKVERKGNEMVQGEHVRDSLLEITRHTSRAWNDDQMANGEKNDGDYQHYDHLHHHLHDHQINQDMSHQHHRIHHYHSQV